TPTPRASSAVRRNLRCFCDRIQSRVSVPQRFFPPCQLQPHVTIRESQSGSFSCIGRALFFAAQMKCAIAQDIIRGSGVGLEFEHLLEMRDRRGILSLRRLNRGYSKIRQRKLRLDGCRCSKRRQCFRELSQVISKSTSKALRSGAARMSFSEFAGQTQRLLEVPRSYCSNYLRS